jgi:hypothetical protein
MPYQVPLKFPRVQTFKITTEYGVGYHYIHDIAAFSIRGG